jgi:hypothetical protein
MKFFGRLTTLLLFSVAAWALSLADISNTDATSGLKEALSEGAGKAIDTLGKDDGFLGNPQVKIPLPAALAKGETALRMAGMGKEADELVTAMNRAAEAAVPAAKPLVVDAIKSMSVDDAKKILTGGDDSVTQFFKSKTSAQLTEKFLPIVKKYTDQVGLAQKYDQLAGQGMQFGLIKKEDAQIESYVTRSALDGLYKMIAAEERSIRSNPMGAAGDMAKKVFGAIN